MIGSTALVILLPFAAAFAGFLLGPRLSRLLRARKTASTTTASTTGPETTGPDETTEPIPGGGPRVPETEWKDAARTAERAPLRNGPALIACLPTAAATVLAAIVAFTVWREPGARTGTLALIPTGDLEIEIGLHVDGPAALVGLMVCCIALAVQLYSIAYMAKDPRYCSYAAFVSLFTAAMLLVVYAGDLLLLYVGWEVMGACSYFLIGHHWEERVNSRAAVKAFLVTRLGDVGFLLGIIVLGIGAGTFTVEGVLSRVGAMPETTATVAALLLVAGVAGKSAQFPLHTWLPDAMAGPTPISALIHAATMVAAGIYVVARLYPVFLAAPAALTVLGLLAVISMIGSALAALAQDDLKRILAYSTVSQLAVMAAGLAVGADTGAIFHLVTHGAFKALLFLAAGCVILVAGSNMLVDYGGLRHSMPVTFWSMTVGLAALAGVPPASGWFSKDSVIEGARHAALHGGDLPAGAAWTIYAGLLVTVALTAAYAMRTWLVTFFGEPRGTYEIRDAPALMSWPTAALAVPAAALGFFGLGAAELRPHAGTALLGLVFLGIGGGAAFLIWNKDPALDPARALGPVRPLLAQAFYVDEAYAYVFVRPVRALAARVVTFDTRGIDAGVLGIAKVTRKLGEPLRMPQNGNPQTYLTGLLAGVVVITAGVVIFL